MCDSLDIINVVFTFTQQLNTTHYEKGRIELGILLY